MTQTCELIQENIFTTQASSIEQSSVRTTRSIKKDKIVGFQNEKCKRARKKHWKPVQNQRYVEFLRRNTNLFQKDREDKRLMKINLLMSKFVKSKTSTQCRSHHQKILIHYGSIQAIINNLEQDNCVIPVSEEKNKINELIKFSQEPQAEEKVHEVHEVELWNLIDMECWGYNQPNCGDDFSDFPQF